MFLKLEYLGALTTERLLFKPIEDINELAVDKNYYMGHIDWELEYEMNQESEMPKLLEWLCQNKIEHAKSVKGKYQRYIVRKILLRKL